MTFKVATSFRDLKKKSSGGGGFSDGGVHVERHTLTANGITIGPPPGVAWSGFNAAGFSDEETLSVQAINFDPAIGVAVEEYFVFEDGTEQLIDVTELTANVSTTDPSLNAGAVGVCSEYLEEGGVIAYPNKLRYKLVPGYQQPSLPTGRVLLHFDVVEFDLPKDQE